jgi:hypothetical protein
VSEEEKAIEMCLHCGGEPNEAHECPYRVEIHNNDETCNCCDDCTRQCAMDI